MTPEMKALLKGNFWSFVEKAFFDFEQKPLRDFYVAFLSERLRDFANGASRRMVLNLPPRHLKTFTASICLTAWLLGRDPARRVMIVSYGEDLAREISQKIRRLVLTPWYQEAFPGTRLDRTKATDLSTTRGGSVFAVSIKGSITGRGAHLIIIDDPHEIDDGNNPIKLQEVADIYDTVIFNRLDDPLKGQILIVAHRIDENDLSGHVLKEGGWTHLAIPFMATQNSVHKIGVREWRRAEGTLLQAFPDESVKKIMSLRNFHAVYQQNPGGGIPAIEVKHFRRIDLQDGRTASPIVLSIDAAETEEPRNSFSVLQAWHPRDDGFVLVDQWRGRVKYGELRQICKRWIHKYRPSAVLVESFGVGSALLSDLESALGSWVDLRPIRPQESKGDRLRDHVEIILGGKIILPRDAPWLGDFIAEFLEAPQGRFMDQVDATTQFLAYISGNPVLQMPPVRATGVHPGGFRPSGTRILDRRNMGILLLGGRRR